MKKFQTATEYLIILAVVIVIALIVVGVIGGIPSIGSGTSERQKKLQELSNEIGISSYAVYDCGTKLTLRNNNPFTVQITGAIVNNTACSTSDLPASLAVGESVSVDCAGICSNLGSRYSFLVNISWKQVSSGGGTSFTQSGGVIQGVVGINTTGGSTISNSDDENIIVEEENNQEICTNLIDDDENGLMDCQDPMCPNSSCTLSPGTINSCGTLSSAGTYTLANNISNIQGECFIIESSGITLDGGNHKITGVSASGQMGILSNGNYDNLIIENFAGINNFGSGWTGSGMTLNYMDNSIIRNVHTNNNGRSGFQIAQSNYNQLEDITSNGDIAAGIEFSYSNYNQGNRITIINSGMGVYFPNGATHNNFDTITITNSGDAAFALVYESDHNTFTNINADDGIRMWYNTRYNSFTGTATNTICQDTSTDNTYNGNPIICTN